MIQINIVERDSNKYPYLRHNNEQAFLTPILVCFFKANSPDPSLRVEVFSISYLKELYHFPLTPDFL